MPPFLSAEGLRTGRRPKSTQQFLSVFIRGNPQLNLFSPRLRGKSGSSQNGNPPQHFSENSCFFLPPFATLLNVGAKTPSRTSYDPCCRHTDSVHQFLLAKSQWLTAKSSQPVF